MTKRGSSQFLLLFLRPTVRFGLRIGGALALIALVGLAGTGLAPVLHQSAWKHALASDPLPKAWPWETNAPVAQTEVARLGLSAAVNVGTPEVEITPSESQHGRNERPQREQLGDVAIGDRITVTGSDGSSRDYRVTGRKVVGDPHLAEGDSVAPTGGKLSPVTCWPLDAVAGSLRLIIQATGLDQPKAPPPSVEQKL
jgi:hypothetical protein